MLSWKGFDSTDFTFTGKFFFNLSSKLKHGFNCQRIKENMITWNNYSSLVCEDIRWRSKANKYFFPYPRTNDIPGTRNLLLCKKATRIFRQKKLLEKTLRKQ